MSKHEHIVGLAIDVVNMFDQANTNGAIEKLGFDQRGLLLKRAITDLRNALNADEKQTILTEEQAGSYD